MIKDKRISVCMATYNGEKYIRPQLQSILDQLTADDEIIVSDDGSSDNTLDIVRSFNDSRIIIINHKKQPRKYKIELSTDNFENAMRHASGKYIFFSDQDDLWLPGKVDILLRHLESNEIVLHDCRLVDGKGDIIAPSFFELRHPRFSLIPVLVRPSHLGCCMAIQSKIVEQLLPFPHPGMAHDLWIAILGCLHFKPVLVNDVLVAYRKHDGCVTALKSNNSLLVKLKYRVCFISALMKYICSPKFFRAKNAVR